MTGRTHVVLLVAAVVVVLPQVRDDEAIKIIFSHANSTSRRRRPVFEVISRLRDRRVHVQPSTAQLAEST